MLFQKRGGGAHVAPRTGKKKTAVPEEEYLYPEEESIYPAPEETGSVPEEDPFFSPEEPERRTAAEERRRQKKALRRSLPFFLALGCLTVYAWLLPLRPSYSELERRDLAPFPSFSVPALLSGDWFDGISQWFSDTFPGRESWVRLNGRFKTLYGLQGVSISGGPVASDPISSGPKEPSQTEAPAATPAPTPSAVMAATPSPAAEASPAPAATPEPTPDPAAGVEFNSSDSMRLNAVAYFGDAGYELYGLGAGNAEQYGLILGQAASKYAADPGCRMFSVLCPNSGGITLSLDTYDQLYSIRQDDAIDYFYTAAGEDLIPVKIYDTLRSHNQEYLYFRTDHHWTALGAWYAYQSFCEAAGFEPVTLDKYTVLEQPDFLGSFYKSANATIQKTMEANPDTVYAYNPPGNITVKYQNGGGWVDSQLITDRSADPFDTKYLCFLQGGEQYQFVIENQDIEDDSACLLIKDSYGNPFALYLTQHYRTVVMMNFRNVFNVRQVLEEYNIDDIIVLTELVLAQDNDALGRFASDFRY